MAAQTELRRIGGRPSLPEYLRSIWRRREFTSTMALGQLRAQNMDTVLGNLWHLLNPLLLVGVYYLVFGVLVEITREPNFIAFLSIGVFIFHYTQRSVIAGAKSIVQNLGLIRSIQFPRATLPISAVLTQTLAFLPAAGLMLVVALLDGEVLHPTWLLILPIVAMQTLFNFGASFVVARLTDSFHDIQNVLPYVMRLLFYVSGVLYSVDRFVQDEVYRPLFDFNPMYVFITLARDAIRDHTMNPQLWATAAVWTFVILIFGLLFFRAGEQNYGRG